jgi:hypothetical protein
MKMAQDIDVDMLSNSTSGGDGVASSTPLFFNPMRRKLEVAS